MQKKAVCGATLDTPGIVAGEVECIEACRVFERNRRLASALDLDETKAELSGEIISPELDYSEILVRFAFNNRRYVLSLEKVLDEFIHGDAKVSHIYFNIKVLLFPRASRQDAESIHHASCLDPLQPCYPNRGSEYRKTFVAVA